MENLVVEGDLEERTVHVQPAVVLKNPVFKTNLERN
jgi:hypothetical protein